MLVEIVLGLVIGSLAVYLLIKKRLNYWSDRGFPNYKVGTSNVAQKTQARAAIINISMNAYRDFPNEKLVGFWTFLKPALVIRDPDLIKNLLVRDFSNFHDRGIYYNEKADPISGHLVALEGTKWTNIRVKLTPAFSSGKLKNMFPLIAHVGQILRNVVNEDIRKDPIIDVYNILQRYTTDVVSLTSFGLDTYSLEDPNVEFRQIGVKLFHASLWDKVRGITALVFPGLAKIMNLRVFSKEFSDYYLSTIRKTIEYREKNNVKRNDLVDILMEMKNSGRINRVDGSGEVSDEFKFEECDLAAQAFIFFAAGFETSSTTMTYALYELAKHPEIQRRTREEIISVLEKHDGKVTYEAIQDMKYLGMVLDETLRMYPVIRMLSRVCKRDYQIPDTNMVIPKGVRIVVNSYALHHDPQYYPEPEKFEPERFTEQKKLTTRKSIYLPFGEGPRNCIGMRFGLLQSKSGLVHLLTRFQFELTEKTPNPMVFDSNATLLQPKGGLHLKVTALQSDDTNN